MYDAYFEPSPLRLRLWQAASRKNTTDLLERVAELEVVSLAADGGDITTQVWRASRTDTQPFSKLWWEASEAEVREWLLSCLEKFGIERHFSIVVNGLKAEVKGDEQGNWLPALWSLPDLRACTTVKELSVLSCDSQRVLSFFTQEFFYSAVMVNTVDISSEANTKARDKG